MTLSSGTKLGPYEIISPLGAGGMGEVYLANDAKLDRKVAIKVLPDAMTRDQERVLRFEREAKLLASLNHPNIAAIHGFDEADGARFLIMEYVEGETLGAHLKRGPVAVEDALEINKQIAVALEAAHEQGIVHRDLKPANVMIRPDGTVKVLDFGLAKAMAEEPLGAADANSPTITADYTRPGVVLGTAAYMSPEQARGRQLDKRTDIWSFGCVLYETLTGKRTFEGQTTSDVMAKILERDPDISILPHNTPPKIIDLIRRCLEKPQRRRLRDIGDAVLELDDAISARSWTTSAIAAASGPIYAGSKRRSAITWIALVVMGAAIGWMGSTLMKTEPVTSPRKTQDRGVTRVSITIPEFIQPGTMRLSPSGQLFAAIGRIDATGTTSESTQVFTRSFDDYRFRPLGGTLGATFFCFSPDGKRIAFTTKADRSEDGYLLAKIAVDGSTAPLHLTSLAPEWQDYGDTGNTSFFWNRHDEILLANAAIAQKNLMRISTQTGAVNVSQVSVSEGEIAEMSANSEFPVRDVTVFNVQKYVGGAWQMSVKALADEENQLRTLTDDGSYGTVTSTGHLLYTRGQRLLAVPFDAGHMKTTGGPVAIVDGLRTTTSWGNAEYQLSDDGTLAFLPGGRLGKQRRLTVVDRDGSLTDLVHTGRSIEAMVSTSRDGRRAVVVIANSAGLYELWITELDVPRFRRFAAETDSDCMTALWTRDGRYVYYILMGKSERDGLYRKRADGSGEAELVILQGEIQDSLTPSAFSADDRLLIVERSRAGSESLHVLRLDGEGQKQRTLELLLGDSYNTAGADFSPDGKWLVYGSNESGRNEMYIRSFSSDGTLGSPIPVTTKGGRSPRWSSDGKLIYYRHVGKIMVMDVDPATGRPTSSSRVAVDFESIPVVNDDYSLLPDGKMLMIHKGPDEARPTRIEVILNWFEELKERVPTGAKP